MDWFLPGYKAGGPIRSMANIVNSLGDDYEYYIITRITDLAESTPYDGIEPNKWHKVYSTNVYYISEDNLSSKKIKDLMSERDYEMIYLNSLFSPKFTLIPLIVSKKHFKNRPIVIAPRGMLGDGALKFKGFKKRVFLRLVKLVGFYKGIRWHATTEEEKKQIENHFGRQLDIRIGECMTMPKTLEAKRKSQKNPGEIKLFYIGRLSKHKNISYALDCFGKSTFEGKITLDIFGALEEEDYHDYCQKLISNVKDNIQVKYHGPVPYDDLRERIINEFHFLLLPTKGESYSHAVLDSWGCGCPVLVSRETPWLELEKKQLGWNFNIDDVDEFESQLKNAMAMNNSEYLDWAKTCVDFVNAELCKTEILDNNRKVFA